jgi:PAS domain S-box-containing protein
MITVPPATESTFWNDPAFFSHLIDIIPNPVFFKDVNLIYRICNHAFADHIIGLPKEQIIGRGVHALIGSRDGVQADDFDRQDRDILQNMENREFEARLPCSDGLERDFLYNKGVVRDDQGRVMGIVGVMIDISKRKTAEEKLRKREKELNTQSQHLEEVNATLRVLLMQRDTDKKSLQENFLMNIREMILPYLDRLKKEPLTDQQQLQLGIIETNLQNIASPFIGTISSRYLNLTPMELRVANLIKEGKSNKEIAELLFLSENTILFHRHNIRTKLNLKGKRINLRTYLLTLDH